MSHFRRSPNTGIDLPQDVLVSILERLEGHTDLARCALVSSVFNRCATPCLYRQMDFRTVRMIGANRSVTLPQNVLLQKPHYAKYVHHIGQSEPEPGGLGDEEPQIEKDIREALRLCTNLRSFSWVYAAHDVKDNRELADDLDILRALPQVNKLLIRTAAGIGEEEWRKLAQFPGLRSLEIWSHRTQVPQFPGWSANLQETLVSLDLGSDIRRNQRLPFLSELRSLKHLRIGNTHNSNFIFEIMKILPNLESLRTTYVLEDRAVTPPSFSTSLRHLDVGVSLIPGPLAECFWSWLLLLLPRTSLETLHIQSASQAIEVPGAFLSNLTKVHGAVLKSVDVGYLTMSASHIAELCATCPGIEYIGCTVSSPADEVEAVLPLGRNLRELRLSLKRGFPRPYVVQDQVKRWMLREHSPLRKIEVDRETYTGRWILLKDSTHSFEVTQNAEINTWS